MELEIPKKAVVKGIICFLFMRWGELGAGGRGGREICSKEDSDCVLGEALGKYNLERL